MEGAVDVVQKSERLTLLLVTFVQPKTVRRKHPCLSRQVGKLG